MQNKKTTDRGGNNLSVSVLTWQTNGTGQRIVDAISKVKQVTDHSVTPYLMAQLQLPLQSPMCPGGLSVAINRGSNGDAKDDDN